MSLLELPWYRADGHLATGRFHPCYEEVDDSTIQLKKSINGPCDQVFVADRPVKTVTLMG